ncbi:DUF6266 family protein [Geojedonia litorea]|uniref:DUF6266 family protein n=1 Tax=Geojedonia litorea TaxID=1268269 RepID=A0ABV9N107_9FLAO
MATFEKGILGGFSGKVGNVVGARWRGRNVMRSLPQRGNYNPTQDQLEQRERFSAVIAFLNPIKAVESQYFGKPQGDKSRYNLATSYHLKEALIATPDGFTIDYPKVLISKGDLRGLNNPSITAAAGQILELEWNDNSGQGNANPLDKLIVVVYAPEPNLYQVFDPAGTREEAAVNLPLPAFMAGFEVQVWATFSTANSKEAAISSYLGALVVT